jgi:hypothetical protein
MQIVPRVGGSARHARGLAVTGQWGAGAHLTVRQRGRSGDNVGVPMAAEAKGAALHHVDAISPTAQLAARRFRRRHMVWSRISQVAKFAPIVPE